MQAMLRAGELDAVIVGDDVPDDPGLCTVVPDPAAAAGAFWRKHRLVPVAHLVTVRRELAETRPDLAAEPPRLFRDAETAAPATPGRCTRTRRREYSRRCHRRGRRGGR